jgi:hypothetical protein
MKDLLKKLSRASSLSKSAKIVILLVICCLVLAGLSPTFNSVFIDNNDEPFEDSYDRTDAGYKKTSYGDDDVYAYASFYWKPRWPDPGEEITFVSNSGATNGHIISERWRFEDGHKVQGRTARYIFEEKDSYKVTLDVHAVGSGGSAWGSVTHYVKVGADPFPRIRCTPVNPSPGKEVMLDGSESYDPDGEIVSYNWSFYNVGDPDNITRLGSDQVIYYRWAKQGAYVVSLFIEDDKGNNNTAEVTVYVSVLKIEGFSKRSRGINFEIVNDGNFTIKNLKWDVEIFKYRRISVFSRSLYKNSGSVYLLGPYDSEYVSLKNFRRRFCKIKLVVTAEADNAVKVSKSFYGLIFGKYVYLSENDFINPYNVLLFAGLMAAAVFLIVRSMR